MRRMGIIVIGIKQREDMNLWRHDVNLKRLYPKALGAAQCTVVCFRTNQHLHWKALHRRGTQFVRSKWKGHYARLLAIHNSRKRYFSKLIALIWSGLAWIGFATDHHLANSFVVKSGEDHSEPGCWYSLHFFQYTEDLWVFKLETNSYWQLISYPLFDVGISEHISMARGLVHV